MPQRERISNIDTAWLRMEQPTNLMMITGVMIFADKLDIQRLKQTLMSRFLTHKRFLQRVVHAIGGAYWENDIQFDINRHVHRTALPGAADKAELQNLASDLMSTPLDFSKPLWQIHLVEDYQGGSALIMRVHHCYADGIALIYVLLAMTDTAAVPLENAATELQAPSDVLNMPQRLLQPLGGIFRLGKGLLQEGLELLRDPGHAMVYLRRGSDITAELAKLATLSNDPVSGFRGELGVSGVRRLPPPTAHH